MEGLTVIEADGGIFQNFEASHYKRKEGGFQESRVDERRFVEFLAQVEIFGREHDLRERQCIDDRKTVGRKRDVMLRQNHRLMQYQKPEDHPKVKRDHEKILQLLIGNLLNGSS